eukprot:PhF_6_TR9707/c0_g1_i3/m.14935
MSATVQKLIEKFQTILYNHFTKRQPAAPSELDAALTQLTSQLPQEDLAKKKTWIYLFHCIHFPYSVLCLTTSAQMREVMVLFLKWYLHGLKARGYNDVLDKSIQVVLDMRRVANPTFLDQFKVSETMAEFDRDATLSAKPHDQDCGTVLLGTLNKTKSAPVADASLYLLTEFVPTPTVLSSDHVLTLWQLFFTSNTIKATHPSIPACIGLRHLDPSTMPSPIPPGFRVEWSDGRFTEVGNVTFVPPRSNSKQLLTKLLERSTGNCHFMLMDPLSHFLKHERS